MPQENAYRRVVLRVLTRLATAIACVGIVACKIVVVVPEGGKVVNEDGFECLGGETCIIDVSTSDFDATFTAVPDPGVTFSRWKKVEPGFCADKTTPCHLSTVGFDNDPTLVSVLESDTEYFLVPIFATYDVAYWKKTLDEIDRGIRASSSYLYANQPIIGQCDPGSLKQAPKNRALQAVNKVRELHDLPAVQYDTTFDIDVQSSSLMQVANNYLSHFPAPSDACYTEAAADAAGSANLSSGSSPADPAEDQFGWVNDNFNLAALEEAGHRRWMLYPWLGYISYGQVNGFGTLKVFDFMKQPANPVSPDLEFVAMPYGFYPYVLISQPPNPTPWSLSMVPDAANAGAFDHFANAQIKVEETDSGVALNVHSQHSDTKGFGTPNFLSWMVDDWEYDTEYTVIVSGIQMPGGDVREISYPVVVDRFNVRNVKHALENTDQRNGRVFQGRFNSARDKDSYTLKLRKQVNVTGNSEFSGWGFFVLVYDELKRLVISSDEPFSHNFKGARYTVVVSPCDESGLCYQGTQTYNVTLE